MKGPNIKSSNLFVKIKQPNIILLNRLFFFNCDICQDSLFPFNRNSETESVEEEEEASEEEEKETEEKEGEEGQQGGELKRKEEKNSTKVGFQTYNCTNYFQYHHYHHDGFCHKLTVRILLEGCDVRLCWERYAGVARCT